MHRESVDPVRRSAVFCSCSQTVCRMLVLLTQSSLLLCGIWVLMPKICFKKSRYLNILQFHEAPFLEEGHRRGDQWKLINGMAIT